MDGGGNLPAQRGVEDFVEAIEKNEARVAFNHASSCALIEMPAHGCPAVQVFEEAGDFSFRAEPGIFAQFDKERQRVLLEIRHGFLGPLEQEVLQQGGLARAGIAEDDKAAEGRVVYHLQHWARRLVEIGAAMLREYFFVELPRLPARPPPAGAAAIPWAVRRRAA